MPVGKLTLVAKKTRGRPKKFKNVNKSVKKYVKKEIAKNKETYKKALTANEVAVNSVDTAPTYSTDFMKLAQGTTYLSRQGHKIKAIGLASKFLLYNNGGGPMFIRFLALINIRGTKDTDYQTGVSLFEDDTGNVDFSSASNISRMHLSVNREKYKVLRDRVYKLGGTNDATRCKVLKTFIPYKKILEYEGSSSILPEKNNIVLMWFASESNADETTGVAIELHYTNTFYWKNM